jgi:hypothetical protein
MIEKRRFSRVIYRAPAEISQGKVSVASTIQDLSLHGLLLCAEPNCSELNVDFLADIQFSLPGSDVLIEMVVNFISVEDNIVRASIDHIDIESIGHLKRLVELNVGNDSLLHRDIEHLSDLGAHL